MSLSNNTNNSSSSHTVESRGTGVRTTSTSFRGAGEGGSEGETSAGGGDTMVRAVSVVESLFTGDAFMGDRVAPVISSVNKNRPLQQRVVANAVMSSSANHGAPSQSSSNHRGLMMPQSGTSIGGLLPTSHTETVSRPELPTTCSDYTSTTPTVYSGIVGGAVVGKIRGELVDGGAPSAGVEHQHAEDNNALWAVLCDTELSGGDEDIEVCVLLRGRGGGGGKRGGRSGCCLSWRSRRSKAQSMVQIDHGLPLSSAASHALLFCSHDITPASVALKQQRPSQE